MKYKQKQEERLLHRPTTIKGGYLNINKQNNKWIIIYSKSSRIVSKNIVESLNKLIINKKSELKINHTISSKGILVRQGGGKGKIIKECSKIYKGKILFIIPISQDINYIQNIIKSYSFLSLMIL